MASHKHGLGVSISPKRGLHVFFAKKASQFNRCIADACRTGKGRGGSKNDVITRFEGAVSRCKGRRV